MGTRSSIGVEHLDGSIDHIYVHWSGQVLAGVGEILYAYYADIEKIQQLIAGGGLSVLAKHIEPDPQGEPHSFDSPQNDVCVYYHRDRGEELLINHSNSFEQYFNKIHGMYCYSYLYSARKRQWYVISDKGFRLSLEKNLISQLSRAG